MSYSGRSFRHYVEQELGSLPHFVIYAVLEWTLIGLLLLDGFLAFVSSEFADFFDLQAPCVLCTRIDHILARNKSRYCYNETICDEHKKDLSSLAYCHVHRKLSDIRTMCKGCLLSFATDNDKSDSTEGYKTFNKGGVNKDLELLFDDEIKARLQLQPLWSDETGNGNGFGDSTYCSCCGEAMKVKPTGYQKGSVGNINTDSGFLSRVPSRLSQQGPTPSPRAPFSSWRADDVRTTLELSQIRCLELKSSEIGNFDEEDAANVAVSTAGKEEAKLTTTPKAIDADDFMEDFGSITSFGRGNRFFGVSDSAAASPRFANRVPRKSLLDKVELGSDPVEAITGNETDTEVILDRLKKQVRSDRKSLIALYMELDEERGASAVAANNAMAMITRLQAEKASVQMEALQYQRMMEEQAEYDKEDIQMLKDFLNKKEDEMRDLEAELDLYRDRCGLPNVTRGDVFENSQSFSSINEQGSPLFSIGSFYEGEYSGRKNDDDVSESSVEEGENIETHDDAAHHNLEEDCTNGSFIEIEHGGSFNLDQLKYHEVEDAS
ncbi:probable myosin-binding protein 5 [Chenopodium quinoa]|uniref:probable myosin-binding protein 5 n=1 Tax=Chenopodium quinoa TaxID=63459 RepID=UPI000B76D162|nr:probable myosin-binding protein 5 [Chenopodium quinoa]